LEDLLSLARSALGLVVILFLAALHYTSQMVLPIVLSAIAVCLMLLVVSAVLFNISADLRRLLPNEPVSELAKAHTPPSPEMPGRTGQDRPAWQTAGVIALAIILLYFGFRA
jgi:hypothetical protein